MATYEERLATFKSSSIRWPHISPTPEDFAAAGFIQASTRLSSDRVKCTECSLDLDGWNHNDFPLLEHTRREPGCIRAKELLAIKTQRILEIAAKLREAQKPTSTPQKSRQKSQLSARKLAIKAQVEIELEEATKEAQKPTPTPQDIGFFDPSLQQDFPELRLFHDVDSFIKHLKKCADQYREKDILQLLSKCLRGPAFTWSQSIDSLKSASLNQWMEVLTAKFKKQPSTQSVVTQSAVKETPKAILSLPLEYHKCPECSASFSSTSRLLSQLLANILLIETPER